jgi:hypothetical protein
MGVLRGGLEPHRQRPGLVLREYMQLFAVPPFSLTRAWQATATVIAAPQGCR